MDTLKFNAVELVEYLQHRRTTFERLRADEMQKYEAARVKYESGLYYRIFKVPFDHTSIGSRWITIHLTKLDNIERDLRRALYQIDSGCTYIMYGWPLDETHASIDGFLEWRRAKVGEAAKNGDRISFEEEWSKKVEEGYQYGEDALANVKFGFEMAVKAILGRT